MDSAQRLLFPVWPAKAYAERNLNNEWANFTPTLLTLEHFMDKMLPDMDEANITITIMASPDFRPNVLIEARYLLQDLIEERSSTSSLRFDNRYLQYKLYVD